LDHGGNKPDLGGSDFDHVLEMLERERYHRYGVS
jgi:hypothetical protein